ncbi:hypothetical protein MRX96_056782 [Rhipicephalus microplus]
MIGVVEYVIFSVIIALNFGLGLYFSLRRKARATDTTTEMFLGSRALRSFPLAASLVASRISSVSFVGFTGHFYAYGFHLIWQSLNTFAMTSVVTFLFLPVFYGLRITSVFEYIRMRFNSSISLVACGIYLLFTLSAGAIVIFAASLTTRTIFGTPIFLCNVAIGLSGTLYTALGGLRGVVWTDCVQLFFIILGPTAVIANVIINSASSIGFQRAFHELDLRRYVANVTFDIGQDENVWSSLLASATVSLYRVGLDQVAVQRCMASRSLSDAKSTISSIINSQAAVLYMDVLSPHIDNAKLHFKWVARGTAFLLGVVMTACSCACLYMGTITRLIIMMLSAFTGPFVGLMILAISFPFVHAKGAGISTLLMIGFQLVVVWQSLQSGTKPPPMPVTLEYCPENIGTVSNITTVLSTSRARFASLRELYFSVAADGSRLPKRCQNYTT